MKKSVQDRESGLPDPLKNSDLGSSQASASDSFSWIPAPVLGGCG